MSLDPISAGLDLGRTILDKFFPDANTELKSKLEQAAKEIDNEFQLQLAQIKVNEIEAGSTNWFTSNWRPAVGWIGAIALGYSAILEPLARFVAVVLFSYTGLFPVIDTNITMQILFGMLGMGAYRSFDKFQGTAKK